MNLLDQIPLNSEASVLSENYSGFINRLMFMRQIFNDGNLIFVRHYLNAFKVVPPVNDAEKELLKELNTALTDTDITFNSVLKKNKNTMDLMPVERKKLLQEDPKYDINKIRLDVISRLIKSNIDFTLDIIKVQTKARVVTWELKPVDNTTLANLKAEINNPILFNAFQNFNNAVKAKIDATAKIKTGFVRNAMPKTTADSVFSAILKKYKGKAVYVDFWATWCGPCLGGIEEIAPFKEELKNENIAFVYITDPSSPEDTYKKMIPGIAGEHYKLSKDEWNYIAGKYSISGIPRYMLADKEGNIINDAYHGAGNASVKAELLKIAKK